MTSITLSEKAREQEMIAIAYQRRTLGRRMQREGVVVTPVEVVDFQIRSALNAIAQFGREPDDPGIEWLDPFGGTGIYIARLLQLVDLPAERKVKLAGNCIVLEIDRDAAQVCANNLAAVFQQETGVEGMIRVICTDTFGLDPDTDLWAEGPVVLPRMEAEPC